MSKSCIGYRSALHILLWAFICNGFRAGDGLSPSVRCLAGPIAHMVLNIVVELKYQVIKKYFMERHSGTMERHSGTVSKVVICSISAALAVSFMFPHSKAINIPDMGIHPALSIITVMAGAMGPGTDDSIPRDVQDVQPMLGDDDMGINVTADILSGIGLGSAGPVCTVSSGDVCTVSSGDIDAVGDQEPAMDAVPDTADTQQEEKVVFTVEDIEPKAMYAQRSLNVRTGPYVGADKLGTLSLNEQVIATGVASTGWYRFEYKGIEAYASNNYLSESKAEVVPKEQPSAPPGIVEMLGSVDSIWITKADAMLGKLPRNAIDRFITEGWHFYVTDEDIGTTEYGGAIGRVAGSTHYGPDYTGPGYIKIEDRQYAIDEAVLHEFGHFVFGVFGNWYRQEVIDAYNSDVGNASLMGISYGVDDMNEFYGEVFQKYIKNPSKTREAFPNFTAIIQSDLDRL